MVHVIVRILHVEPGPDAGPLVRALADARRFAGERLVGAFREAGAPDVGLVAGPPDDTSFGARYRGILDEARTVAGPLGLVVLGSGSVALARPADVRPFVAVAASDEPTALANNRYSADIVAVARADRLPPPPDLPGDNGLPRWLDEVAGWPVADVRGRWRLGFDLDSPLDVELARPGAVADGDAGAIRDRLAALRALAADRRAEVVVAGRTSSGAMRWLERSTAARSRVLAEERGLRASSRLAQAAEGTRERTPRPPRSTLGLLLDRDGPEALGSILAELGDGALVDSRVLLAHRLGADEAAWPGPEDRFASDLLLADRVADPWLRRLTRSAAEGPVPILLGGHTLVGPGLRLALRTPRIAHG